MLALDYAYLASLAFLAALGATLAAAVWHDLKRYRVPNLYVFSGTLFALVLHTVSPADNAAVGLLPMGIGFFTALAGIALGLAALLPFYLLRAAGAGDVKAMAMVGAFVGPIDVLGIAVITFIAGAMLAPVFAARAGVLRRMMFNLRLIAYSAFTRRALAGTGVGFDPRIDTAARVPYTLAIALGTCIWLGLKYYR